MGKAGFLVLFRRSSKSLKGFWTDGRELNQARILGKWIKGAFHPLQARFCAYVQLGNKGGSPDSPRLYWINPKGVVQAVVQEYICRWIYSVSNRQNTELQIRFPWEAEVRGEWGTGRAARIGIRKSKGDPPLFSPLSCIPPFKKNLFRGV